MAESVREKKKQQTRKKLIKTASRLFAEEGFQVSTSKIAQTAGLAHGSLFLHFPTREDLIDTVINNFFKSMNTRIHKVVANSGTLEEFLAQHLALLQEKEAFYTQIITNMTALPKTTQEKLFGHQSTLSAHLLILLEKEGQLTGIPPHLLFNTWLGIIHYYLQNKVMFAPDTSVIERYKDEWIEGYLHLVRKG
ncbi:TetR/AcrR family transcriptional regulator [Candidatus Enterococcus ferrettii]|uniref:HTH tetR-type domain-containing protein n=1 Tax=Candidatus Enterococcus ferrettii TaxID=2815324 RepID=A0ABV0EPW0_9ENTE|nr:TetR/AcrR family transcriptional regulator [Enterococcus sp. 665A]MBO1341154.1 TetR/AcrR family transcriptional regulator [Enterococcus sp. 665A]